MATPARYPNLWNLFQAAWARSHLATNLARKPNVYNIFASLWFAKMPKLANETDSEYQARMRAAYRTLLPRLQTAKRTATKIHDSANHMEALIEWEKEYARLCGTLHV